MSQKRRNDHLPATATAAPSSSDTSWLSWLGAAGIVAIATLRCCVAFAPQLIFDTDPALDASPIAALGMGGSLLLDASLLIACAIALLGEWRSGRGLDPLLLVLALLPAPIVFWHGLDDAGDLWRGCTWLAAAIACVTIAHLARDRGLRIVITAALLAILAPLLIRGATQMTWEHDATVLDYLHNKETFLRGRGWEPDSPAARIYERRLMNREPTGWFPSTNIYGSIVGAAAIMCAGLGWCAFRAYRRGSIQSGAWFLLALLAVACIVALKFTTSMGALLAMGAGGLMLAMVMIAVQQRGDSTADGAHARGDAARWAGRLMLVMIVGAIAGVIVRGALLPEGFLGEKSLLFRWHYLQAAFGIVHDHPLLGVGPDGFQVAYTQHRPPRNPEEVQSAHSMFVDWIATLGVAGVTWLLMIAVMLLRQGAGSNDDGRASVRPANAGWFALAVALLALMSAFLIEWPVLDERDLIMRGAMLLGFVALAVFASGMLQLCDDRVLRLITAAAATVLLVHGQIEMTFFQGGSVVWALTMVGLVGMPRAARSRAANSIVAPLASVALLAVATWIMFKGAMPGLSQERGMREAASLLDPVRTSKGAQETALRQRPLAAERLEQAYERWPLNPQPLNAAADQLMLAADALASPARSPSSANQQPPAAPLGLLMRAEEIVDRAVAEHNQPASIVLAMNVHASLGALTDDPDQWTRAIALGRRMTDLDPLSVGAWQRLGRVLWAAGEKSEAAAAFQRAIANSDAFDLDPLKQLSAAARANLQALIEQATNEAAPSPR